MKGSSNSQHSSYHFNTSNFRGHLFSRNFGIGKVAAILLLSGTLLSGGLGVQLGGAFSTGA